MQSSERELRKVLQSLTPCPACRASRREKVAETPENTIYLLNETRHRRATPHSYGGSPLHSPTKFACAPPRPAAPPAPRPPRIGTDTLSRAGVGRRWRPACCAPTASRRASSAGRRWPSPHATPGCTACTASTAAARHCSRSGARPSWWHSWSLCGTSAEGRDVRCRARASGPARPRLRTIWRERGARVAEGCRCETTAGPRAQLVIILNYLLPNV